MFSSKFRWVVDREVDWPVWVVLGRSWDLCVRSWAAPGAFVGGLGADLGPILPILGRSWASTGGPGPLLGPLKAVFAPLGRLLGPMLAILGRSWASTGGPGPLLGPLCAVLGRSWSLSRRSWAALGAYSGGFGPLLGPMWAV